MSKLDVSTCFDNSKPYNRFGNIVIGGPERRSHLPTPSKYFFCHTLQLHPCVEANPAVSSRLQANPNMRLSMDSIENCRTSTPRHASPATTRHQRRSSTIDHGRTILLLIANHSHLHLCLLLDVSESSTWRTNKSLMPLSLTTIKLVIAIQRVWPPFS